MGERKSCNKTGRNARKPTRLRYWASKRLQVHREARLAKHIARFPGDLTAPAHLRRIEDAPFMHVIRTQDAPLPKHAKEKK